MEKVRPQKAGKRRDMVQILAWVHSSMQPMYIGVFSNTSRVKKIDFIMVVY